MAQDGLPHSRKLLRVCCETLHPQPALPFWDDAPGGIAQMGLRQAVVEHRSWSNLLMRENRAHPLLIQVREERQEIERPLAGRVCRQVICCQVCQVRPVVRIENTSLVGLRLVGWEGKSQPQAPTSDLPPEVVADQQEGLEEGRYRC